MPRMMTKVDNQALYQAALEGLEIQRQKIEDQMRQVRAMLGVGRPGRKPQAASPAPAAKPAGKKRELSAAARKRIAAAQKKRWAEFRKKKASGE